MPPLLHGQAEAGGHRWPRRALRAPVRAPQGSEGLTLAQSRRQLLLAAKLKALVRDQWGEGDDRPGVFPGGAALVRGGTTAFVLLEDDPAHGLGGGLAWTLRQGAAELRLLAADAPSAAVLARRAAHFDLDVQVWSVHERTLTKAVAGPVPSVPEATDADRSWSPVFEAAGADAVEEWGVVSAEVLGLEVARVVDGELKVGVGKHDRWAHDEIGSHDLDGVIGFVQEQRRPGSLHQLASLVRERWLRRVLLDRPGLVGVGSLAPAMPPSPRLDLQETSVAPTTGDGVFAVCAVGPHLDTVPSAADALVLAGGDRELVIVVPEGDDLPVTRDLAAVLRTPARVQTVPADWQSLVP